MSVRTEVSLFRRAKRGNLQARDILIEHNYPLVIYIAKNFVAPNLSLDELCSAGVVALIRCVDDFRIEKRCRLSTYAYQRIKQYIKNYIRRQRHTPELKTFEIPFEETLPIIDQEYVHSLLTFLPLRTQCIIKHYYGIDGYEKKTFSESCKIFNISPERARRLYNEALKVLRKIVEC